MQIAECVAGTRLRERLKAVQSMARKTRPDIVVRVATLEDSLVCGQICFDAFSAINAAHGFPCDFPGLESAAGVISMMFASPDFYCVVAESDGRIVGSNCHCGKSMNRGGSLIPIHPGPNKPGVR